MSLLPLVGMFIFEGKKEKKKGRATKKF